MKKFLMSFFTLLIIMSILTNAAFATSLPTAEQAYNEEETFVYIWDTLLESGDLAVSEDGYLHVYEGNALADMYGYERFLEVVETINVSIRAGLLVANKETGEVTHTPEYDEEAICAEMAKLEASFNAARLKKSPSMDTPTGPSRAHDDIPGHDCGLQRVDLMWMCSENYQELEDYFNDILLASLVNPTNAFTYTTAFWINGVKPGGVWDYKSTAAFGPYDRMFCTYYDGAHHHITAEYIGNFNYGYTGSFLFNLNTLHFGSSAVAGFDPADQHDWPAIDAGYYRATSVE